MYMANSCFCLLLVIAPALHADENSPNLGKPATKALIQQWNKDVFPNGEGLPAGQGTAVLGELIYQKHCLTCHGVDGIGDSADELAGASHSLTDNPPDKTIGTYWPYATTLFDFTRRAMPLNSPASLNNDELYSVTAYLLYLNGIVERDSLLNKETLAIIKMPNRTGFINIYNEE